MFLARVPNKTLSTLNCQHFPKLLFDFIIIEKVSMCTSIIILYHKLDQNSSVFPMIHIRVTAGCCGDIEIISVIDLNHLRGPVSWCLSLLYGILL